MKKNFVTIICLFLLGTLSACSTMKSANEEEKTRDNKVAEINIQLGMAYLAKGDVQRSKQKFLYAKQKAPQLPEVWYSMAYFLQATGNTDQAEAAYLKSIELAPKRGDVLNNYGTFLCSTGKYAEAVTYFIAATKDQQYLETADAFENAGLCALKIPDRKQATQYFNLALEADPTRITSMNELNKLKQL